MQKIKTVPIIIGALIVGLLPCTCPAGEEAGSARLQQVRLTPEERNALMKDMYDLVRRNDEESFQRLVGYVFDEDPAIRRIAASVMGRSRNKEAFDILVALVNDPDTEVRSAAAMSIGLQPGERSYPVLIDVVNNDTDQQVKGSALTGLSRLGYDKALEKVISCLKSDDAVMRSEAAGALGSSRDKRAVEALIDAVGSSDTGLRINARRSLLRITGQHALYEDTKDKSPDEAKTRWRLWWEANKDGFSPRRQKRRTVEKADRAETLITRYDADNNGCLDKNELQKYFSDRSRRPETVKKGASLDAKMPVKTMDGKEIELSSLLKGPSILYFFATKCGYCVKAESFIKELSHLCKEKEMPLIGIASSRETVERLAPYIERTGFDFPIVIDYKGKFSQNNKVRGTPNVLVIDGKGTVADVYRGLPEQSKKQLIETVKNGKFLK